MGTNKSQRSQLASWIKVNVDGAISNDRSRASIGGLFRDELGNWKGGFYMKISQDSVIGAELRAILMGLQLAWDKGFRKVVIESDAKLAVEKVYSGNLMDPHFNICANIRDLLGRGWCCKLLFSWREANRSADGLAKRALHLVQEEGWLE